MKSKNVILIIAVKLNSFLSEPARKSSMKTVLKIAKNIVRYTTQTT